MQQIGKYQQNTHLGKGWSSSLGVNLQGNIQLSSAERNLEESIYVILGTKLATNGDGEEITRSVTIETFDPTLVEPASDSPENSSSVDGSSSSSRNSSTNRTSPQNPNSLSPSELPPQFD